MRAVYRQTPQVLAEMMPSWRQQYDVTSQFGVDFKGDALNVSGPLVNTSIRIFGTKQVMALRYHCVGEIVPAAGAVPIKWFTNWDKVNDKIPDSLFSLLGTPQTLRQGNWSVPDQFEYSWFVTDCGRMAHYVSTFRKSFLVAGLVHADSNELRQMFPQAPIRRLGQWS